MEAVPSRLRGCVRSFPTGAQPARQLRPDGWRQPLPRSASTNAAQAAASFLQAATHDLGWADADLTGSAPTCRSRPRWPRPGTTNDSCLATAAMTRTMAARSSPTRSPGYGVRAEPWRRCRPAMLRATFWSMDDRLQMNDDPASRAIVAVNRAAAETDLDPTGATVIKDSNNTIILLPVEQLVAKVPTASFQVAIERRSIANCGSAFISPLRGRRSPRLLTPASPALIGSVTRC